MLLIYYVGTFSYLSKLTAPSYVTWTKTTKQIRIYTFLACL